MRRHFLSLLRRTGTVSHAILTNPRFLTVGNPENGLIVPQRWTWTEEAAPLSYGPPEPVRAGRVLQILDLAAAQCSTEVVRAAVHHQNTVFQQTTVAVTNTLFSCSFQSTDHVRTESHVINAGKSSIGVYVRVFRDALDGTVTPAGESFFTMTMITKALRPAHFVPAIELASDELIYLHKRYRAILQAQKENMASELAQQNTVLTGEDVQDAVNCEKKVKIPVSATKQTVNRLFMQAYVNNNDTIFGGELMSWMEQVAVQCGRRFTQNTFVYTLGMHSMEFRQPVLTSDYLELEAKVIYVRRTTMEVDVTLHAHRREGNKVITNRAAFVLVNADKQGVAQPISCGLDVSSASQEELREMMNARGRYARSRERKLDFDDRLKKESERS